VITPPAPRRTRRAYARPIVTLAALSIAFVSMHGCSSDATLATLAEGCSINSDCKSPLICAFQACHVQCVTSVDCPAGDFCVETDRPYSVCEAPIACTLNSDCPPAQVCGVSGTCRNACQTARDCIAGQACVSGTCADESTKVDAGRPSAEASLDAATGVACIHSSDCPSSLICLDTGYCGAECLTSKDCTAGAVCVASRCTVPAIDAGTHDATTDATTHADSGGRTCSPLTTCGDGGDAYCANTATDNVNCGACGHPCGTDTVCAAGECVSDCTPPLTLCGATCVDPRNDPDNCSACGKACGPYTNATPVCVDGACAELCQPDRIDCSTMGTAGCTVTYLTDVTNCGGCGNVCLSLPNATPTCTAGACGYSCKASYLDCDGLSANGCEVLELTDPNNCGACGNACSTGCTNGVCTLVVTPFAATLLPVGAKETFSVAGGSGADMWSATLGTVMAGSYTAPMTAGVDTVTVTDSKADSAKSQVVVVSQVTKLVTAVASTGGTTTTVYGTTFDGTYLYVSSDIGVSRLDSANNLTICAQTAGGWGDGITFDGTYLYRVNGMTLQINKFLPSQCNTDNIETDALDLDTTGILVTAAAAKVGGLLRNTFTSVTADGAGHLYFSSSGNGTIKLIDTTTGAITAFVTTGGLPSGTALSRDGKTLYVANQSANIIQAVDIATKVVTTLAGDGLNHSACQAGVDVNGVGTAAGFGNPSAVATDGTYLYVLENTSSTVRQINLATLYVGSFAGSAQCYTGPQVAGPLAMAQLAGLAEGLVFLPPGASGTFLPGLYFGAGGGGPTTIFQIAP